jgi:hydroxypyruvate reductase
MTKGSDEARVDAEMIFRSALGRVDPADMIGKALRLADSGLGPELVVKTELEEARFRLSLYDRILVAGMGKAGARMALGLEAVLGDRISGGLVAVKEGHSETLTRVRLIQAGHPLPDERSVRAAEEMLALGEGVNEGTLIIVLISGGGSSILCAPAPGLDLGDKIAATRLLLSSGADIQEMNCVRKHLSAVKGGRLAAAFAPATVLSLILSDVIGDDLDAIASGPTVPDPTTWADASAVVRRRGIESRLPLSVVDLLRRGEAGELAETPKPGDPVFARTRNMLIGTNRLALMAAEEEARSRGYATLTLSSRLRGEAREVALALLGIGQDIVASGFPLKTPACLIVGGETTVTLRGPGLGGRNQEMALAFTAALKRAPNAGRGLVLLAASTDGSDGPTDAAGAFASSDILAEARRLGLDPDRYLADNDSYHFFEALGVLLKTGPTGTNVCDIQVLIAT